MFLQGIGLKVNHIIMRHFISIAVGWFDKWFMILEMILDSPWADGIKRISLISARSQSHLKKWNQEIWFSILPHITMRRCQGFLCTISEKGSIKLFCFYVNTRSSNLSPIKWCMLKYSLEETQGDKQLVRIWFFFKKDIEMSLVFS